MADVAESTIGSPATQSKKRPNPPSTVEWEAIKEEIKRLYIFMNKPLAEVIAILDKEHSVRAS